MDDKQAYQDYLCRLQLEQEKLCRRCGACCGAFEDPCEHLMRDDQGMYFCAVYENRFGMHKSRAGRDFQCVPIRDVLHKNWKNEHLCSYKRQLRLPWKL